jgi:hypothetical protein
VSQNRAAVHLHKMKTAGEVISERGCYSLPPTDLLNSVDRVDWEPVSASAVNQGHHNATVSGMTNGQRNGQRAVNGQRSFDRPLTAEEVVRPLDSNGNPGPGQRVNAVNGSENNAPADPWADLGIPDYLNRRPALGPPGDSLDDLA